MRIMGIKLSVSSLTFLFLSFANFSSVSVEGSPIAPALYVFGDSLFDSGNNNFLPTLARANFLPYGTNFPKGATGRFTNGKTVADFIAEFLGLPYAPPNLSIHKSTILTGLNYASGSCGILPETGSRLGKCLNLKEQLDLFDRTVKSDLSGQFNNSNDLAEYLSKSIFLFSVGNNDYLNNYLQPDQLYDTSKHYPPPQFAQLLMDDLSHHFERLYNLGARKTVMFEIGPLGCIPSIAKTEKHDGDCVQGTNQLASIFNERLRVTLADLTFTFQGSLFVLGRANGIGYDAITSPLKYGLKDGSNPCCKTWNNGTSSCIPFAKTCSQPNSHFFWDAFHLTESANSVIATGCFNGSTICTPLNIQKLVQI